MQHELGYGGQGEPREYERVQDGADLVSENPDSLRGHQSVERAREEVCQDHHCNVDYLVLDEDAAATAHEQAGAQDQHDAAEGQVVEAHAPEDAAQGVGDAAQTAGQGDQAVVVEDDLPVLLVVVGDEDPEQGRRVYCYPDFCYLDF